MAVLAYAFHLRIEFGSAGFLALLTIPSALYLIIGVSDVYSYYKYGRHDKMRRR
jgi:hypothetical protein